MEKVNSVDAYLLLLEPWMQEKFTEARHLILTFPEIKERIRYNAPFYDYKGMMLYMGIYRKKRLVLGFCNGKLHPDKSSVLMADAGQTQIKHWEFFKTGKTDLPLLVSYIEAAMQVQDKLHTLKYGTASKKSRNK